MAFDPVQFLSNGTNNSSSGSFNPSEFLGVATVNPTTQQEIQQGLLGGTGQPMSRQEAINLSKQRFVARANLEGQPNIQLLNGNVVDTNQLSPLGSLLLNTPRAFSAGQNFGITNVAEKGLENLMLATGLTTPEVVNALGVKSQINQETPLDVATGIAGGFATGAPAASEISQAPTLLKKVISSASTGSQAGALNSLNNQIATDQSINPTEIGKNVLVGGVLAGTISVLPSLPSLVSDSVNATKNFLKNQTPVDPAEVARAQKNINDLIFKIQQDQIKRKATNEGQNFFNINLEEQLVRAQQEARDLGARALEAHQQLGPQIEQLMKSAQEAPNAAAQITSTLPEVQQPSQFGQTVYNEIYNAKNATKQGATVDYSAVRDSLPADQPSLPSPAVEEAANLISQQKEKGYSAAFPRNLRSVIGESVAATPVDPLSNLSPGARNIYENLPDSQKQNFLNQAGIDLNKTVPKTYTWDELQQRYQDLNRFIEDAKSKGNNQDAAAFQQLKNALSSDLSSYAQSVGTDTKALFDQANANFAANAQKFGNRNVSSLIEDTSKQTPSLIASKIIGENKPETIQALQQILSPEKFQQVQAQYAHELFSPSKGVAFDANHFLKQFDRIGDETLAATFGQDGLQELYKIRDMAQGQSTATDLQSTLNDYNKQAQQAQDAYNNAKSKADEDRITREFKQASEDAVQANQDKETSKKYRELLQELKKAQTPEQISLKTRFLFGLGTYATTGKVGAAIAATVFAKTIHRNVGNLITESIANSSKVKPK